MCLEAVRQNPLALECVKEQTPDICMAAVKQDGMALAYVKAQTPEICLAAVKQNGMALKCIPKRRQTLPIAIAALKQDPYSWTYLSDKFRKPEVYKAAGYGHEPEDIVPSHSHTERDRTEPGR